jgi:hypothetical protein
MKRCWLAAVLSWRQSKLVCVCVGRGLLVGVAAPSQPVTDMTTGWCATHSAVALQQNMSLC